MDRTFPTVPTDDHSPDAMMTAPAGQALLALIDGLGLTSTDLAEPLTAFHVATDAMNMISRWDPTTPARLERLAIDTPARRPIAEEIMGAAELAWWWAPLDRGSQLWSSHAGSDSLEPGLDRAGAGPMSHFERYAHKPHPTILTSTAKATDISSLIIASAFGNGDLQPHPYDAIRRCRFAVHPAARVYEIGSPGDWAALARRYPAIDPGGHHRPVAPDGSLGPGEPPEIVPDWLAVARDWDGVHVSLGGMLLATDVWVADAAGSSRFWGWDCEGTYWLRWSFNRFEPLPDLAFDAVLKSASVLDDGDRYRNPVLAPLLRADLLMAGDGPEAVKLRSSSAVGMVWPSNDGSD
jgi:hypothetical protein